MIAEDVAEYRRLLEDFHEQIAQYDEEGARVTNGWLRALNDPGFPRHLLAEHTLKVSKAAPALAILALERGRDPGAAIRLQMESTQAALAFAINRLQDKLRRIQDVLDDRGLEGIVGEFLSSVEFVMDYVQLRFCGAMLTTYRRPHVQIGYRTYLPSETGYRDALCSLIGETVEDTEVCERLFLRVAFGDGRSIRVPLNAEDPAGQESVSLWSAADRVWTW